MERVRTSRALEKVPIGKSKSQTAARHSDTIYQCEPDSCPVRSSCTRTLDGSRIRRPTFEDALARQRQKQHDPAMRTLLGLRKEIVEHIFGIVRGIDGFRRFTVRGLHNVQAQWLLACTAVNLRKPSDGRGTEPASRATGWMATQCNK